MIYAAGFGDEATVRTLLANGAKVGVTNSPGLTPLHFAAMGGFDNIAELLISKGADVNAKDNMVGGTPLFCALQKGHSSTANLLREHGGKE